MSAMALSEKAVFLQQRKIPALVINDLSASLTFGAFAMLAASPDELAKTVQDSLSSEAVAMLNPFVLANIKAAWSAALSTFASSSSGQPSSATTLDAAKLLECIVSMECPSSYSSPEHLQHEKACLQQGSSKDPAKLRRSSSSKKLALCTFSL